MDPQLQEQIQELQHLEQQLQQIGMQKQSLHVEQAEVMNATKEITATTGDIYRIVAGLMVKIDKQKALKELTEREKQVTSKLTLLEKHEETLVKQGEQTRQVVQSTVEKQKKKA
ncbi:prefoldin subunit beta [Candidatus Pacearchaeota archaeon]|nr:prefoldin subunit beta [Candidatus Pacearchaeota archaeon]